MVLCLNAQTVPKHVCEGQSLNVRDFCLLKYRAWPLSCFLSALMTVHIWPTASLDFVGFLMSIQGVQKDLTFPLGSRQKRPSLVA